MAMTQEQFERRVARYEQRARQHPALYKFSLFLLALLGYGYLALMMLILLALFLVCIAALFTLKFLAFKLVLPVGAFLWMVVRALWVSIPAPDGFELERAQAPELFAVVERLRRKLRAPRFHRILITGDLNAGVVQVPRLGILGWHRNYLLIGLPLLQSLTVVQFEAVLAHEFGHLAGGHARAGNWIYRLRMAWVRLLSELEQAKHSGVFMFRYFFNWYAPYFSAYSFPLARANEYEADHVSARVTSPEAAAEALTGVTVIGAYLSEGFWPKIHANADDSPRPAFAPYADIGVSVSTRLPAAQAELWLKQGLSRRTSLDDTHPSLSDRLAAIGQQARLAPPAPDGAADVLLGAALARVIDSCDKRWQTSILESWIRRHNTVQDGRRRLAALEREAQDKGELSDDQFYERAQLIELYGAGPDEALVHFRALRERLPENALVCFAVAQRLLARDDVEGIELAEKAMMLHEDAIGPGCELLRDYYWRHGEEEQAHAWHARLLERSKVLDAARAERSGVGDKAVFEPNALSAGQLQDLRSQLQRLRTVRRAYLVRKQLTHLPHRPLYILGYVLKRRLPFSRDVSVEVARSQIAGQIGFPGEALVVDIGVRRKLGRKLRAIRDSQIL